MSDNKKYKGVYGRIDVLLWTDLKFKCLSDDSKIIFLYMLTGPHKNILGFYFLPIPYGAYDLGWDVKRFDKGLHELLDKDLISYDFETSVVFIKNFLKYNPLENPNQVTGAIKAFNVLPPNSVTVEIATCLKRSDKPLLKPLIERLEERLSKPVTVTVTATATATATETVEPKPNLYEGMPDNLIEALEGYADMRKLNNKKTTEYAKKLYIKRLKEGSTINGVIDIPTAIKMVENATVGCWSSIFPLKENKQKKPADFLDFLEEE